MLIKTEKARRMVVIAMFFMFFIPMGATMINTLLTAGSSGQNAAQAADDAQDQIVEAEEGYQIVLERESNNVTALEGLLQLRLATGNWTGAKEPLETLIKLNPENESYQTIQAEVNSQLSAASNNAEGVNDSDTSKSHVENIESDDTPVEAAQP